MPTRQPVRRCGSSLFSLLVGIIELAGASLNETAAFSETSAQSPDPSRYLFVGNFLFEAAPP